MPKKYYVGIDLLRIVSMCLVVMIHLNGYGKISQGATVGSGTYYVAQFLSILSGCAVNCFIIMGGFVNKNCKVRWERILQIWIQVFFYSLGIAMLFYFFMPGSCTIRSLISACFPVLSTKYWFVTFYIPLMFCMPYLNMLIEKMNLKDFRKMIMGLLIIFSIIPWMLQTDWFNMATGDNIFWFIIMFCIGAYIRRENYLFQKSKKIYFLCLCGLIILQMGMRAVLDIVSMNYLGGAPIGHALFASNSPLNVAEGVLLLIIFSKIEIPSKKTSQYIQKIAGLAFAVYLVHDNEFIRTYFVKERFLGIGEKNVFFYLLYFSISIAVIFIISILIEFMRRGIGYYILKMELPTILSKTVVNVISLIDVIILKNKNRSTKHKKNGIVLVRLDAIGDFVMWLDAAKNLREDIEGELILICNKVCKDIAESTGYFDDVIALEYAKLRRTSKMKYRWSIYKKLEDLHAEKAIQFTYSKELFSDLVMSAIDADIKITIDSPEVIQKRRTYQMTKSIYQQIIDTPPQLLMECKRNNIFIKTLLNKEIMGQVPYLKPMNIKKEFFSQEPYFVLFPGASEKERMWPIERFAQIAKDITRATGWKCVICGGTDEEYLFDKFAEIFLCNELLINNLGQTTLPELIEIIRHGKILISNDTSAVHFATATNTIAICIYGPWEYGRFLPYNVDNAQNRILPIVIFHNQKCENCMLKNLDKTKECKNFISRYGIRKCVYQVQTEDVEKILRENIHELSDL